MIHRLQQTSWVQNTSGKKRLSLIALKAPLLFAKITREILRGWTLVIGSLVVISYLVYAVLLYFH